MKKRVIAYLMSALSLGMVSCQDWFLEMPDTSGMVDKKSVFSSSRNAKNALMTCYREALIHGLPGGWGVGHGTLGAISGEVARGYNWHGTYFISESGLNVNGTDGSDAGADNLANNWTYIRHCFTVRENIDLVPDMTDEEKGYIKAEATALVAYRYMGMFYRYGGVPIVRSTFTDAADEGLQTPRATLQETLDYIVELCDKAFAGLPTGDWPDADAGRMTRGAVLAIKARALLFAARPLFNSATPYMSNGHDELICFGNSDPDRWQKAAEAAEEVLTWAEAHGYRLLNTGGTDEEPNSNAFVDYATATSTPGKQDNPEVLLAYKCDDTNQYNWPASAIFYYNNYSPVWTNNRYDTDQSNLLTNFLELYYREDGTELTWPKVGENAPHNISEWSDNIQHIEARAKADNMFIGFDALNNEGNSSWSVNDWGRQLGNADTKDFPTVFGNGKGCAAPTKFYYKAGSRTWFEAPLFRMAEIHLNLAEAYNEMGETADALKHLNKVHNRAGLPSIKTTDQAELRAIIHRERAIEFYRENMRYYDVKHWKDPNIGNGIIGGQMRELHFRFSDSPVDDNHNRIENLVSYWDGVTYTSYWNPKMYLEPIPQQEINKGILVQNPGY